MTVEMGKVNEKINHIEELMTSFIAQIAAKSLQPPSQQIEVLLVTFLLQMISTHYIKKTTSELEVTLSYKTHVHMLSDRGGSDGPKLTFFGSSSR